MRQRALRQAEDTALEQQRAAVQRALADQVPQHELDDALAAVARAKEKTQQLEKANDDLTSQIEALSDEVASGHSEVANLQELREVHEGAIAALEATLHKIEKHVSRHGGAASAAASSRDAHDGVLPEDIQLASLSRQIVNAKLAEADAQRKLRISARAEVEHRQKLATQAERINALKGRCSELHAELSHARSAAASARLKHPRSPEPSDHRGRLPERAAASSRQQSAGARVAFHSPVAVRQVRASPILPLHAATLAAKE